MSMTLVARKNDYSNQINYDTNSSTLPKSIFFQSILESLVDGIIILNQHGAIVHANARAYSLCQKLPFNSAHSRGIPQEIWQVYDLLIDSEQFYPDRKMVIELEALTCDETPLRLRGRWFTLDNARSPYILVTLEDYHQSLQNLESTNKKQYGFTDREAEIWSLRRTNHSYKEIAAKLYISENTVKKHMKSIKAKLKKEF